MNLFFQYLWLQTCYNLGINFACQTMIAIPSGFSSEEYLSLERENTVRHEYRRGLVYAMAGGSDDHSRLTINFLVELQRLSASGERER
jgi:Uma2 family endonuclease